MALSFNPALRNNRNDEITTSMGTSGLLVWMSGTKPAAGGAKTTVLATQVCSATFAAASSGGVLTINAIANDTNAANSGTPTWARFETSANAWVVDMTAGLGGADANLDVAVVATGTVAVSSATITDGNP